MMFLAVFVIPLALYFLQDKKEKGYRDEKEAQYPDSPWLWGKYWEEGTIYRAFPKRLMSLFKIPSLIEAVKTSGEPGAILGLPIMLVALVYCVYKTLRWFKFGRTYCDLVTNPGVVGGRFQVIVWCNMKLKPSDVVEVKLVCYEYEMSRHDDKDVKVRDSKWEYAITVPYDKIAVNDSGLLAIPVDVFIPEDCIGSIIEDLQEGVEWELEAKAKIANINLDTSFLVPVFDVSEHLPIPKEPIEEDEFLARYMRETLKLEWLR